LRKSDTSQSFLDIGTGSGILAIAAAKLGYARVLAFDFDPDAVRIAKQNAAANRVEITIRQQDLAKLPLQSSRRFNVVCANLTYDLLIQQRDRILGRLEPAGTLVLAGILRKQFPAVRQAYVAAGMKLAAQRSAGEWQSGAFLFA
jgi:ribosomal protein L11 methyltransferase